MQHAMLQHGVSSTHPAWQQQRQPPQPLWLHTHSLLRYHARPAGPRSRTAVQLSAGASADTQPSKRRKAGAGDATPPGNVSSRNARLYELFEDDGWGVEAAPAGNGIPTAQPRPKPASSSSSSSSSSRKGAAGAAAAAKPPGAAAQGGSKPRKAGTPFAAMRSEEGVLGLSLLHRALLDEEAASQAAAGPDAAAAAAAADKPSIQDIKARLAAASSSGSSRRGKAKLLGFPRAAAGAAAAGGLLQRGGDGYGAAGAEDDGFGDDYGDDEEEEGYDDDDDDDAAEPAFEISFDEQGRAAFQEFGSATATPLDGPAAAAAAAGSSAASDDEDELEGFGMSGWGQFQETDSTGLFGADDEGEEEDMQALAAQRSSSKRRKGAAALDAAALRDEEEEEQAAQDLALLQDMANEDDWGLEALTTPGLSGLARRGGRRSLVDELTAAEEAGGQDGASGSGGGGASVVWGGSAGTTGIDMEEQEALLQRYFRPDQVKKLMAEQQEVDASYSELRKRAVGLGAADHKLQERLRIIAGSAAGRKLVSFRSAQTRPMMEKVRQAIFNMLQSRAGTLTGLPRGARWLDLFAGTGSVGLEALSRGVKEAHLVEMDPVVVSKVLARNIKACGFKGRAWTHTSKAEEFLARSAALPRFAGGPFDYISVCPPYLLVSYPELFELLSASPLLHPGSVVFVEYPKQLAHQVVDTLGPLQRVRDRRYGRTWVALYAAAAGGADGDAGEDGDGSSRGGGGDDDGLRDDEDPFLAMGV